MDEKDILLKLKENIDKQECIQYISEVTTDIRAYNGYKETLEMLYKSPLKEMQREVCDADDINDYLFEHQIIILWKSDGNTDTLDFSEEKTKLLSKILYKADKVLFDFEDNSWSLFFKIYIPRKPNDD